MYGRRRSVHTEETRIVKMTGRESDVIMERGREKIEGGIDKRRGEGEKSHQKWLIEEEIPGKLM